MAGFNYSRCYIIILIYLFLSNCLFAQHKVINLHSDILNEERTLNVYLPDNYKSTQIKYPVLYQLDGEEKNFLNVVHTIRDLSSSGEIPGMIVVGIKNTDRWRDMLPVKQKKHPTSGGANNFYKFLHLELVRYIDNNFRTNHVRILSGRSNSALFTVFVLTEDKNVFTGYIASSPSLRHCKDYMFNKMTSFLSYHSKPVRYVRENHPQGIIRYGYRRKQTKVGQNLVCFSRLFIQDSMIAILPSQGMVRCISSVIEVVVWAMVIFTDPEK